MFTIHPNLHIRNRKEHHLLLYYLCFKVRCYIIVGQMLNRMTTIIKFIIWNSSNITVWVLQKGIDKSIWKILIPRKQKQTTVNGFNGRGKAYRKNELTLKTIDFISASSSSSNFFSCKVYIAQYVKIVKMMLEIKRQNPGFCFQYFITYFMSNCSH